MAPTKSTPAKEISAAAPEPAVEETKDQPEPQKRSTQAAGPGEYLWYRGDSGAVLAVVTSGTEGEAEVLLLRADEVVKGRAVAVYETAADAEKGYGEGQAHVAWHI